MFRLSWDVLAESNEEVMMLFKARLGVLDKVKSQHPCAQVSDLLVYPSISSFLFVLSVT